MYRRRNPKTGKREGNWYISVGGARVSSGTEDRAKAKWKETHDNDELWDRQNGRVTPVWEKASLEWMDNHPVIAETYEVKKLLRFWKDHLKGRKLVDITPKLVHQIITDSRVEDGSRKFAVDLENPVSANSTANGYVAFVSRIIRHGSNLNPKLTYYPKPGGRDRWLTLEEWETLSGKMGPDLKDVSTFALATGLRQANVMGLRWSWVKGDWLLIPPEFTKTEKPYGIPLNRTAQDILKTRKEMTVRHPELVFLNRGKPWYRVALCDAVRKAVQASDIPEFTFHCFRHTFASWLAQKGVSHAIRARLGCWATGSIADHYSHFDVESLRQYAELIDEVLTGGEKSSHQSAAS